MNMDTLQFIPATAIPSNQPRSPCPACNGTDIVKSGKRYNQFGIRQRFRCKTCGISFSEGGYYGFKAKFPLWMKHYAITLYQQGYSLQRVAETIATQWNITVSRTAIMQWMRRKKITLRTKSPPTRGKTKTDIIKINVLVSIASTDGPEQFITIKNWIDMEKNEPTQKIKLKQLEEKP